MVRALWLVLLVGSCASNRRPVEIDENDVFSGGLRATVPLNERDAPSSPGDQMSLDFELTLASGTASQRIPAGGTVELDDEVFAGPGEVDYDFEVLEAQAFWRPGYVFEGGTSLHGLLGFGLHHVELEGELAGLSDRAKILSVGGRLGGELGHYVAERTRIFARVELGPEFAEDRDAVQTSTIEFGITQDIGRHFALGGGWRSWKYEAESESDSLDPESDIELELSGPQLWIGFRL